MHKRFALAVISLLLLSVSAGAKEPQACHQELRFKNKAVCQANYKEIVSIIRGNARRSGLEPTISPCSKRLRSLKAEYSVNFAIPARADDKDPVFPCIMVVDEAGKRGFFVQAGGFEVGDPAAESPYPPDTPEYLKHGTSPAK
jgi:hypothetical protein